MNEHLNNLFSRRDLEGVNPVLLECQLKLYNVKEKLERLEVKVLHFYKMLESASKVETREGEEAEFWRATYESYFDEMQIRRHGE